MCRRAGRAGGWNGLASTPDAPSPAAPMNTLAVPLSRRIHPTPARTATRPSPPAGRWLAALVVAVLLAAFGLAARGGR
jgi:hypothetical protein